MRWTQTWRNMHPDWNYVLFDSGFLTSRRWRNQDLIQAHIAKGRYKGVADLIRYEILLEGGGFIPEADSECTLPCDGLFDRETAETAYENEKPGLVSPFFASVPGHPLLETIIADLGARWTPETLRVPWRSTGNRYLKFRIEENKPDIVVFPSHYFIPDHKSGLSYHGDGPVYARQHWGTTGGLYEANDAAAAKDIRANVLKELKQQGPSQ